MYCTNWLDKTPCDQPPARTVSFLEAFSLLHPKSVVGALFWGLLLPSLAPKRIRRRPASPGGRAPRRGGAGCPRGPRPAGGGSLRAGDLHTGRGRETWVPRGFLGNFIQLLLLGSRQLWLILLGVADVLTRKRCALCTERVAKTKELNLFGGGTPTSTQPKLIWRGLKR